MAALMYIAGPITNVPNYRQIFAVAEQELNAKGWGVFNPARLPSSTDKRTAMGIDLAVVLNCSAVLALPGYLQSVGAMIETALADYLNIPVYKNIEEVPDLWDQES